MPDVPPALPPCAPRRGALRASLARALPACLLLAACSSPSSGAPAERSPGGTASAASGAAAGPWSPADLAAQRKACSAPCRGQFATLVAHRDARGDVKRYESPGSPGDCSHPPLLFFDERGEQTGAIPLVPVVPGSEQARKFDAIRQEQTAGLRRAEEIRCESVRGN